MKEEDESVPEAQPRPGSVDKKTLIMVVGFVAVLVLLIAFNMK
jgi:hypothetical protein